MKGQKLAVLKALRQAGTTGLTKREIRDMCGAENVAQRVKELRDEDGYTIQLVWDKLQVS